MVTKKKREAQLRFVSRYSYKLPEDLMDQIDFEAYADPEITFSDNVWSIAEAYPSVKDYLPTDWVSKTEEAEKKGMDYYWNILRGVIDNDPEALETIEDFGYTKEGFYEACIDMGVATEEEIKELEAIEEAPEVVKPEEVEEEPEKPPKKGIDVMARVKEINNELQYKNERVKQIAAEEYKSYDEVSAALYELAEMKPRVKAVKSEVDKLLDTLEERTNEYETTYNTWSFSMLLLDRIDKIMADLEERETELMKPPEKPEIEEKHAKIFDTISEMVEVAGTGEELSEIEGKIAEVPLPESMKEQLTIKVEEKRKKIFPERPPEKPAEKPPEIPVEKPPEVEIEIEDILGYLRAQKEREQPIHSVIEQRLERLRELSYPDEKIEEIKEWF